MSFFALLAIGALLTVALILLTPRPKSNNKPGVVDPPTIQPGTPIPVIYGRVLAAGVVVWFDGFRTVRVKKRVKTDPFGLTHDDVDLGYDYHVRMATLLGWGDGQRVKYHDIRFDERLWLRRQGQQVAIVGWSGIIPQLGTLPPYDGNFIGLTDEDEDGTGQSDIFLTRLYGGNEQEGGVEGTVRNYAGNLLQLYDPYIQQEAEPQVYNPDGTPVTPIPVPYWYDQMYVVHEDTNMGMSPYLKLWEYEVERQPVGELAPNYLTGESWGGPGYDPSTNWEDELGNPAGFAMGESNTGAEFRETTPRHAMWSFSSDGGTGGGYRKRTFGPEHGLIAGVEYPISVASGVISGVGGGLQVALWAEFIGETTVVFDLDTSGAKQTGVVKAKPDGTIDVVIWGEYQSDIGFVTFWIDDIFIGKADTGDANIADILWDALTNRRYGLGISEALLEQQTFIDARNTMNDEGMGIAKYITQRTAAQELIDECLEISDGVLDRNPVTGRLEYKLVRFSTIDRPHYQPDEGLLWCEGARREWHETINDVTVNFTNRARDYAADSVGAKHHANISMTGSVRPQTLEYASIHRMSVAQMVASRALHVGSLPLWKGTIKLDRRAYATMRGDGFQITWPDLQIAGLWVRVLSVDLGKLDEGVITCEVVEDAFQYTPVTQASPARSAVGEYRPPGTAYQRPVVHAIISQTGTEGTVGLQITDPSNLVTAVEWAVAVGNLGPSGWVADGGTREQVVTLMDGVVTTVMWKVSYTEPDGTTDTIEGSYAFSKLVTLPPPVLQAKRNVDGTFTVTAVVSGATDRVHFLGDDADPPIKSDVELEAPDTVAPFEFTTPVVGLGETYYVGAVASDGTLFSALAALTLQAPPPVPNKIITANVVFQSVETGDAADWRLAEGYGDVEIVGWDVLLDAAGTAEFDIWTDAEGNYPPTVADSIIGAGTKPTCTGAFRAEGVPTGWTRTTITDLETIQVYVHNAAGIGRATLVLKLQRA